MTEQNTLDYLSEVKEEDKESIVDKVFLEGICPKCLDSGFVHTVKDDILGMAYRIDGEDSVGKPIKRLLICDHSFKTNY